MNAIQVSVKVFDASPSSSTSCGGDGTCPLQSDENNNALFLRISSWSYNTELGFHYLANVLNRNTCFSQGMYVIESLVQLIYAQVDVSVSCQTTKNSPAKHCLPISEHLLLGNASKGANLLRHQFLQTWEHTERLFSALKTRALFMRDITHITSTKKIEIGRKSSLSAFGR